MRYVDVLGYLYFLHQLADFPRSDAFDEKGRSPSAKNASARWLGLTSNNNNNNKIKEKVYISI